MAGGFINVNMGEMMTTGGKVINSGDDFKAQTERLYQAVDSLEAKWQGTDNKAYVTKVNEYKDDMLNLAKVIVSYGEFIRTTAKTYMDVADDIASAASKFYKIGGKNDSRKYYLCRCIRNFKYFKRYF